MGYEARGVQRAAMLASSTLRIPRTFGLHGSRLAGKARQRGAGAQDLGAEGMGVTVFSPPPEAKHPQCQWR
jgi:hypothetical protein